MTPQEYGDSLIEKFKPLIEYSVGDSISQKPVPFAIICAEQMIYELNGHNDLHGFWQNDTERQSVVQRITFYRKVIEYLKTK